MSHLQYFDYPGFGERVRRDTHYAQAVRVDNRIELSGQGGWDRETEVIPEDRDEEVDAAFANVEYALRQAGGTGFDQVYRLRIYVLKAEEAPFGRVVENLRRLCPNHQPLLTVVGVAWLYGKMTIEIEAEAHIKA